MDCPVPGPEVTPSRNECGIQWGGILAHHFYSRCERQQIFVFWKQRHLLIYGSPVERSCADDVERCVCKLWMNRWRSSHAETRCSNVG